MYKKQILISAIIALIACTNVIANAQILNQLSGDEAEGGRLWSIEFNERLVNMTMKEIGLVEFTISSTRESNNNVQLPGISSDFELSFYIQNKEIVEFRDIKYAKTSTSFQGNATREQWSGNLTVEAILLGHTKAFAIVTEGEAPAQLLNESLSFIVIRKEGTADIVYKICVTIFVLLLYVNFGALLELDVLKKIIVRPIGPAIGLTGQFVVMPLVGYFIGYILFRDFIELRLGLFFTAASPAGGASNIFTVILNGNLNLSITMTALSNIVAFAAMPFWIFTLGSLIFRDGNLVIPYQSIALMSCALILPLSIGIALQIYAPKMAVKMSKVVKPVALVFIIAITIFSFVVNSYFFKLFTWKIIIASSALPWIGYVMGWLMATACKQSPADALTIAIETGIQNIGIAIFMLIVALPQPQADMTSAVPVATSMMTPIPLLLLYFIRKFFYRTSIETTEPAPTKEARENEVASIVNKSNNNNNNTVDNPQQSAVA